MQELDEVAGALETFVTDLRVDQPGHLLGTAAWAPIRSAPSWTRSAIA